MNVKTQPLLNEPAVLSDLCRILAFHWEVGSNRYRRVQLPELQTMLLMSFWLHWQKALLFQHSKPVPSSSQQKLACFNATTQIFAGSNAAAQRWGQFQLAAQRCSRRLQQQTALELFTWQNCRQTHCLIWVHQRKIILLLLSSDTVRKLGYRGDRKQNSPCHMHGFPSPLSVLRFHFGKGNSALHSKLNKEISHKAKKVILLMAALQGIP